MVTGLVYDRAYLRHDTGEHVESARRLALALDYLKRGDVLKRLVPVRPRPDVLEEVAAVHGQAYVEKVREFSARGGGSFGSGNVGSRDTYDTALLAAGGVVAAVEAVLQGVVDNAFALVRPPGHHARPSLGMGFCFFNNVAVGARYAQKKYALRKVLVVDWDEHHGNGTEKIFYEDRSVLFFSVHRDWSYPCTGMADRVGEGEGEGYNINVPLPRGAGDADYELVFRRLLLPVALAYGPELVLVSAGMDAHRSDPVGQMDVTAGGFAVMASLVREIAVACCGGALVAALEGGYNPGALAEGVQAVLEVMSGRKTAHPNPKRRPVLNKTLETVEEVIKIHSRYWPVLA